MVTKKKEKEFVEVEEKEKEQNESIKPYKFPWWILIVVLVMTSFCSVTGCVGLSWVGRNLIDQNVEVVPARELGVLGDKDVEEPVEIMPAAEEMEEPAVAEEQPEANLVPETLVFDREENLNLNLPASVYFRQTVNNPGDDVVLKITITRDYDRLTLQRFVADDLLISAIYYPADGDGGGGILFTDLLQMTEPIDPGCPSMTKDEILILESRGVNCTEGEILGQNMQSIFLGTVKTGSYLIFKISDDPNLDVNNGSTAGFSWDTDDMTVDLNGDPVEATFTPEGYGQ